jgi:predicted AlkP superfamily phosphohydrolase/phosphomutase
MLLIVGLDGASLDLARQWAHAGTLPNLRRVFAEGVSGPLRSTLPPATFPAWTTFMTGVNPGRHGIFDFARRVRGRYAIEFINGSFRKAPTVWRRLSEAGKRVAVFGVPGTYPPEPINGCMLSGFDTPVTVRADASFVYPRALAAEIAANGGFPFADFQEFDITADWHREALRRLLDGIALKTRFAVRQLQRERFDCAMVLFGESDTVAHHFWRFCDPASPRYDREGAAEFGHAIQTVYAALDHAIGELRAAGQPEAVLVCSDHGFGGAGRTVLHLNRVLEHAGLLRWRERRIGARAAAVAKREVLRWLPARVHARCFRFAGGRVANALESANRFADIDWSRTSAFSEELNYFPSIWLNLRGRESAGTVDEGDAARVCDDVEAALGALRDPDDGSPVVRRVWRRDELYSGDYVADAPDLVLELNEPAGYSYGCLPSRGPGVAMEWASDAQCRGGKLAGMSGSHRRDGLFALAGESVVHGTSVAHIADATPTILALCDVPIPPDLDGRVLPGLGVRASNDARPIAGSYGAEIPYTASEAYLIEQRLRAMGYLE